MSNPSMYILKDNGKFPNSRFPVLHYPGAVSVPVLFAAQRITSLFKRNGWTNNWRDGIYTYAHYHSNTHEAMAVIRGRTTLQLGGEAGTFIKMQKGDLLIIPAGVAHKNMGHQKDVICIGGYPEGTDFDMNTGQPGERPATDAAIAAVPLPANGPLCPETELFAIWSRYLCNQKGANVKLQR